MKVSNKKISIGRRILLGTIFNILLMFGLAGFNIYNVGKFHNLTRAIVEGNYKIIDSARIIGKLIANMNEKDEKLMYLDRVTLEQDSTILEIFSDNKEEVEWHLDNISQLVITSQEREYVKTIKRIFPEFCNNYYVKIAAIKRNEPESTEKIEELSKHQIALVNHIQKAVKSIITVNDKTIDEVLLELDEIKARTNAAEYWVVLATLILFIGFGYFLYSRIRNPIETLKNGTHLISHGQFGTQININSGDEFEELASAFNKMSEKIKKLDELKSEFVHVVTHELRTPLTSMKEANKLIKDKALGPITPKQAKFLNITEQGINRLVAFIGELLELSKVESSLYKVNKKAENIVDLVSENLIHLDSLIKEKNIKVVQSFHKNIPLVELDHMMISRVVTNILSNAIKHTPTNGEIGIGIGFGPGKAPHADKIIGTLEDDSPVVSVYVRDSGKGIDSENLNNIFSKFYQVKKSKEKTSGSGLGLAIAKEIILAHKGLIGVKSKPGRGACFFFVLPVNSDSYTKRVFSEA